MIYFIFYRMHERKKRSRVERLVDKYAKARNLETSDGCCTMVNLSSVFIVQIFFRILKMSY